MIVIIRSLFLLFLFAFAVSAAIGQETRKNEKPTSETSDARSSDPTKAPEPTEKRSIVIHLVGGGKLQVEEARETSDGIWYKRGNVTALVDRKKVERIERPSSGESEQAREAQSSRNWTIADASRVNAFFLTKFGRPLPMSAVGQSDLHDRWGWDHRQGIDVGLHPDSPEGVALVRFLRTEGIPFLVFRNAIPGVATGPHIHIGNPSHRITPR